jgi:NFACT protein RNA binding domain
VTACCCLGQPVRILCKSLLTLGLVQRSQQVARRYMANCDVFVHADIDGAPPTIVKNHVPHTPVSPLALTQAGTATICRSKAWDSKIVTSAWWARAEQVTKEDVVTGGTLPVGRFAVRGRKNYLPPSQLVMGFGVVFRLGDDSLERHAGERAPVATTTGLASGALDDGSATGGVEDTSAVSDATRAAEPVEEGQAGVDSVVDSEVDNGAAAAEAAAAVEASADVRQGSGNVADDEGASGYEEAAASEEPGAQAQGASASTVTARAASVSASGALAEHDKCVHLHAAHTTSAALTCVVHCCGRTLHETQAICCIAVCTIKASLSELTQPALRLKTTS